MANEKNINILIEDLKRAVEIDKNISQISITNIDSPLKELLSYSLKHGIINNTKDLLTICKEVPYVENLATKMYDEYMNQKLKTTNSYSSGFGGTYRRLQDAPGYGTVWNERCVPDDVYVGSNRCGETYGPCRC